jgi:hypothetical protein
MFFRCDLTVLDEMFICMEISLVVKSFPIRTAIRNSVDVRVVESMPIDPPELKPNQSPGP